MRVVAVPVLSDNYAYLVLDDATRRAAVVDPAEPDKVLAALAGQPGAAFTIDAVWTTHHHSDHAGGNADFVAKRPGVPVLGADDRVEALSRKLGEGDTLTLGRLQVAVHLTPCHTSGSCCYVVTDPATQARAVFTGDTVFTGGCGRFFEGDAGQMLANMDRIVHGLPGDTAMYSGHEYTVANLKVRNRGTGMSTMGVATHTPRFPHTGMHTVVAGIEQFAEAVEPTSAAIQAKLAWATQQRASGVPTVPSTLAEERAINPFARTREPTVQAYTGETDPVRVIHALRERKNNFRAVM